MAYLRPNVLWLTFSSKSYDRFYLIVGSRPSDHYFRSVCLFVQSFSQPSLIRFR